ncbi:hypothetical protein assan_6 [Salmonella phage assan]|uniref:Upper collar connector n=1 Tax=Salmonella phage assan TaxID=2713275 RepID=A0A6G8RBV2_9CAUD|nr:hypothetical protein assan_6 [Salmonella phage assan]
MPYDYKAKTRNINQLNKYMLAKTLSMFEYQGLPETIPQRELERLLQTNGYAFITKAPDGELYAFSGSLGGTERDPYGQPTQITIANVALNFNKTLDLNKDGVLLRNDDLRIGVMPVFEKCNTLLVENDVNMVMWGFNSRIQKLITAPDDKSKESADLYMKKIIDGDLSIIGDNAMFDGVKMQAPAASSGAGVQQMIEYQQYIKSEMFNEVGLSSNFNMKRERLISSEVDQAEDSLFPLVYNMMENRISGIAAINETFGLNITVDFGSVWALKNKKLVDGVTGNNNEIADSNADVTDNGTAPEQAGNGKPNSGGEQETTVIDAQPENGNDNGEPAQSPDTVADTEQAQNNDPDNNQDNQQDVNKEGLNDEQEQHESGTQDISENSGDDSESEKQIADLQAVIDDPESSDADKQAAQELLNEIKSKE